MRPLRLARYLLALLALQLASACDSTPEQPPPAGDTAAPVTRASPAGGSYPNAITVSLLCDDAGGSGCAATHYTTDGSEPTRASPTFRDALALSTATTLRFFSVDKAGNAEAAHAETYSFDTTAPTVAASLPGGVFTTAQTVSLTCKDAGGRGCAAIRYTLDGSAPMDTSPVYQEPLTIKVPTTLHFAGWDKAGNTSAIVTERYVIDTAGPTTTAHPGGGVFNFVVQARLICDDVGGSGCEATYYTLDGSAPTTASARYNGAISITTSATLRFFSVDKLGLEGLRGSESYVIDLNAPATTISPAGGNHSSQVQVTLTCEDTGGSGCDAIFYTATPALPLHLWTRYQGPFTLTSSTTLSFFSVDRANNRESPRSSTYTLDLTPPTTTASSKGGAYGGTQQVAFSCSDGVGTGCARTHYTLDGSTPTVAATPAGRISRTALTVTLTCDDGGTACQAIHYTLDGSAPTLSSATYSAPLNVASTTTLRFLGVDAVGNVSTVATESYVIDTQPPTTTANPAGGNFPGPLVVTLSCADAGGSSCQDTFFTLDGSTPTTGSTRYTGPLSIVTTATLRFFSTDAAGNAEASRTQTYTLARGAADTSAQIAFVRSTSLPDGAISQAVDYALVTYVKPLTPTDPAGFFLQAEQSGPALFVAVDPATLTPATAPGDRVSLVATQKATVAGQVRVTGISGYTVHGRGENVSTLLRDGSTEDVVSNLGDFEGMYLRTAGTVTTDFTSAGSGHVQATLSTLAVPLDFRLKVRLPTALQEAQDVTNGCSVATTAPLWRNVANAQASAWVTQDLEVLSCPAPKVLSARALDSFTLSVLFDRYIDPASVNSSGTQFTFDAPLATSGATVLGKEVRVTTSAQEGGRPYLVTVANSVRDTRGTAMDTAQRSTTFTGYETPALLRLNEVAPNVNISGQRDLIELVVVASGSTANMTLWTGTTLLATLPAVRVHTGDIIVIHLNPGVSGDAPASETQSPAEYSQGSYAANYDTAWDFHGGTGNLPFSSTTLLVKDPGGVTQDAVPFAHFGTQAPAAFATQFQTLQAEGLWLPADCGGAPCTPTSTPTARDISVNWSTAGSNRTGITVYRIDPFNDTNTKDDWAAYVTGNTLGRPNL
ncbi:chitobiase/beta-hexosaminidase C-terminal domain-containing protein [Myxococcaceae bacterium GXIMD 01537]